MGTLRDVWATLTPEQRERARRWARRRRGDRFEDLDASQVPEAFRPLVGRFLENRAGDNASVRAPCCGREAPLDGLLDLRGIAQATRRNYLSQVPEISNPDAAFICGACRAALLGRGVVEKWRLAQATGAPADVVERLRNGG